MRGSQRPAVIHNDEDLRRFRDLGVPDPVAERMVSLQVGKATLERVVHAGISWAFIETLLNGNSIMVADDVKALVTLHGMGVPQDEVQQWARIGPLDKCVRMILKGVSLATAQQIVSGDPEKAKNFLPMREHAARAGIHAEDLSLWFAGGVLLAQPPYLHSVLWPQWRSFAVQYVGFRAAAIAVAAGLTPVEAKQQVDEGTFNLEGLKFMASLRGS